jgi:hypothetical protein
LFATEVGIDTFLQINDQINTVLNRYESFKKGDYVAASNPIPSELAATSTRNELSLIDFDDTSASSSASNNQSTADDIATLFGPSSMASTTTQSMFSTPSNQPQPAFPSNGRNIGFMPSASLPGTPPQYVQSQSTGPGQFGSIALPVTGSPHQSQVLGRSTNYFPAGGIQRPQSQPQPRAQHPTPPPPQQQPISAQATATTNATTNQQQGKDPFADLVGLF